jgi:regulator of protease activity HflC (stomatin/prohibitin superfamily)
MRYAFGTLLDDLTPWFILGFAISATIVVAVPDGFFEGTLFTGWTAMLAMLVAGVPLYVCATASTPIAAAMMAKGLEPGAALVFLLAGPATNVATILVVRDLLGMRALVSYLGSIAVVSLLLGTAVNAVYPALGFDPRDMDVSPGAMEHGLVSTVSGVVLAALLLRSAIKTRVPARFGAWVQRAGRPIGLDLTSMPARIALGTGATALYLSSSLTSVGPGETVFIERFGRVAQEHSAPGLIVHAPWPIDSTARVSTSLIRSVEFGIDRVPVDDSTVDALALMAERRRIAALEAESETLTSDGLLLSVRFGAQYRVQDARRWRYGQSDPEDAVSRLAQDALRRAVAVRTAEEVLVGASGPFIEEVERRLTADLERNHLGASLVRVFLHDVHAPPAVHDAYRAVASAMEDAITAEKKAQVSRVERLSQARAEALRVRSDALADRLEEEASATGVASAFKALVEVHGEHPSITEQSLLTDSFERAMRPADDGARRVVLPLSDNIEIIPLVGSDSPPPPPVLDESFNPRR